MTLDTVHASLLEAVEALGRAGNPIAWSDAGTIADVARRRWRSLRRRGVDKADRPACIRDVAKGLIQAIEEDPRHVGPEKRDYEEIAAHLVDILGRDATSAGT